MLISKKWRVKGFCKYSSALTILGIEATVSIAMSFPSEAFLCASEAFWRASEAFWCTSEAFWRTTDGYWLRLLGSIVFANPHDSASDPKNTIKDF